MTSKTLALTSVSLRISLGSALVFSLMGCDGLARLVSKPDPKAEEPVVAEAPPATTPPIPEEPKPAEKPQKISSPLYQWNSDGRPVTRIVVNTTEQKARFYAGEDEIGWSTVATGVPRYPTPTGQFQVTEKVENKRSNLYGKVYGKGGGVIRSSVKVGRDRIPDGARFEGAHMPFFMRLTDDGVGLHAGPIPNPGQPASHGCIRMPKKLAPVLFRHVSKGTSVTIEGKGPSYGDYLAQQRANARKRAAEQQRVAERRANEPAKARKVAAKTTPAPAAVVSNETIESRAEARDISAPTRAPDATTAQETRIREPTETVAAPPAPTASAPPSDAAPVVPAEQTAAAPSTTSTDPGKTEMAMPTSAPATPTAAPATPATARTAETPSPAPAAPKPATPESFTPALPPAETAASSVPPPKPASEPTPPTAPKPPVAESAAPVKAPEPAKPTPQAAPEAPKPAPEPPPAPPANPADKAEG
ncbi:L,D-transpeptidase [Thiocystis violacea]|uniref:L,D-transpeptidase n=1 Tax=Thiocystis violacea TaxID=13725 RepID=UPI0019052597|nr:L,D-transpeptidase [Thiocystis violacea]